MLNFLLQRLGVFLITLWGISIVSFSLIRLVPGDPVLLLLGDRGADPQLYAEMKATLGLHLPIYRQYFEFIGNALQGDLGASVVSRSPVVHEFFARFPATLELTLMAMLFGILLGIPLGILAAINRNGVFDYSVMFTSLVGYSMPIFWWGLILIIVFSVALGWTPVAGRISVLYAFEPITGFMLIDSLLQPEEKLAIFADALRHLALPAIAMGTIPLALIARITRSSMLEIISEDYMLTAKAKGVSKLRLYLVHGLRNALIPIVTVIGLLVSSLVAGAILTETIFSFPGIGKWILHSITARDYPVVQGGILLIGALVIIINLSVDLLYVAINPKMRGS
ncbi:MAG: ABC transporter permease subunit [Pseudomonadota bacterium]|nr:ABC transporter permease subunit [Pseudomonadota bacterium]